MPAALSTASQFFLEVTTATRLPLVLSFWTKATEDSNFFFLAEDGIRDIAVTGVQTCALPISAGLAAMLRSKSPTRARSGDVHATARGQETAGPGSALRTRPVTPPRTGAQ